MDQELIEILESITKLDPKKLKREKGDFQFTDISREIEAIISFAQNLSENVEYFKVLPDGQKQELKSQLVASRDILIQIDGFNPTAIPNPQEIRDQLAQQVIQTYQPLFNFINQFDIYLLKTVGSQAELSDIIKEAKRVLTETKKAKKEINDLVQTSKKTASKIPLYKYLGIFSEDSENHKNVARNWFIAAIILTLILLGGLYFIGWEFTKNVNNFDSTAKIYAFLIIKLFFLAVVIFALQQTVRNYLANMHQSILSKHRENSLKVFDALIKNTDNKDIQDQVLAYLSKTIFDSGETGFFPGKDVSKDGPDIIRIFKDITKAK